jgi:Domain of unknown function (DUF6875)
MARPVAHKQAVQSRIGPSRFDNNDITSEFATLKQVANNELPHVSSIGKKTFKKLATCVKGYLMIGHDMLGRTGPVCPYTAQASRHDTLRLAVSMASHKDHAQIYRTMRDSLTALDAIPCKHELRDLRTIIVAFPNCMDEAGIRTLQQVQTRLGLHAMRQFKMIGLFHANTNSTGLWNEDFRPLKSPFPLYAVRYMVVEDAPFALRHLLMLPAYLAKFPLRGSKRLLAHLTARAFGRPQ